MPLIQGNEVTRLDLPTPGEWVEVKTRVSKGDLVAVMRTIFAGVTLDEKGRALLDAGEAVERATFATLERVIVRWSFDVPPTAENLRALDIDSFDAIKDALEELYPQERTEEERKNSNGHGPMPVLPMALPVSQARSDG